MTNEMTNLVNQVSAKVIAEGLNPFETEAYLRKRLLVAQKDSLSKADYARLIRLVVPRLASKVARQNNLIVFVDIDTDYEGYSIVNYIDNYSSNHKLIKIPNTREGLHHALHLNFKTIDGNLAVGFHKVLAAV